MSDAELLEKFNEWMARREISESLSALTGKGIGTSTAMKLVSKRYKNRPSSMMRKILIDLLAEQKAS